MHSRLHAVVLLGGALFLATLLGGCSSSGTRVRFEGTPNSVVEITDSNDRVSTKKTPFEMTLNFKNPGDRYEFKATPIGEDADRFNPLSFRINEGAADSLPVHRGSTRLYEIELKSDYQELETVEVVFDRSGKLSAVVTQRRSYSDIAELTGAPPQQVAILGQSLGLRGMAMSPEGDRIVFSVASAPELGTSELLKQALNAEESDLRVRQVTRSNLRAIPIGRGSGIEQITRDDYVDIDPAYTADGSYLLFASNRNQRDGADILRIAATSGVSGVARIFSDPRGARAVQPSQARNGTTVFNMIPEGWDGENMDEVQVWVLSAGQYPTQIATGIHPRVSPDGARVSYISKGNLWVCGINGDSHIALTSDAEKLIDNYATWIRENRGEQAEAFFRQYEQNRSVLAYGYPSWDPSGRYMVYTSISGQDPTGKPNEDIWLMDLNGQKHQLTTNYSTDRYPLVSRDGFIYFFSNRGGNWAIWRLPVPAPFNEAG